MVHVDDEPGFADVTAEMLEREDDQFTVETATDVTAGLHRITDNPPDCVVSDYDMPKMNGIELLISVRETHPDLPFILFTGKGSEEVASDAISAGATDYLQKQTGTDHYQLLANRIQNAVENYRSQQQLQRTQDEYEAVFENAQSALLLVDVEDDGYRFRRCNPKALELSGLESNKLVGKTPREALGPEDGRKVAGAYRRCTELQKPVEYILTLDHPVGEVVHDVRATPVVSDGEIEQLVIAFNDITDWRRRQQELEDERTFFQQALDTLDDVFYVVGRDGRLKRWNERVVEVTGYDDDDLDDIAVVDLFPEDEHEAVTDGIETALTEGRASIRVDLLTADGRRIPYEFAGRRLTDSEDDTTGLVGIGRRSSKG